MAKFIAYNETHDQQIQAAIEEVLEWFDFDKVEKVMAALDWRWHHTPEGRTPNKEDIVKVCVDNIHSVWNSTKQRGLKRGVGGSGGFEVTIEYYKKDDKLLVHVLFYAASWTVGEE